MAGSSTTPSAMREPMGDEPRHPAAPSSLKRLTVLCLLGLAAGALAGLLATALDPPGSSTALSASEAVIRAWTNAFRVLVVPLVVAQLFLAVADGSGRPRMATRLGLTIPIAFVGLLVLTTVLALVLTTAILSLPRVADVSLPSVASTAAADAEPPLQASAATWVDGFIPPNLLASASTDNILPLMIFTLAFAVAVRRADIEAAETLLRLCRAVSHASFTLVGWLLRLAPLVMLGLGFSAAAKSGATLGGVIIGYVVLESVVLVMALLMLYLVGTMLAGVHLGRFSRALWPAQLTAIATRSSLATLPALLRGADSLRLRPEVAAAALPMAGSLLKLSRAVSGPVRLLFLAHVLGVPLDLERLVIFSATIILLSSSTVGVPSVMSGNRSLPAYVAAGIPVEYVLLLNVVVSLTDVFRTVLNSSGYLTAAVLVDRFGVRPPDSADARVAVQGALTVPTSTP